MIWLTPLNSLTTLLPQRICEFTLAWVMLNMGLVLSLNDNLSPVNPVLISLFNVAGQPFWAVVFFTVGAARLTALFINGAYFRTPHARAILAWVSVMLWYQLSAGVIAVMALSASIYPVFVIADSYNAWRAAREAGVAEGTHEITHARHNT